VTFVVLTSGLGAIAAGVAPASAGGTAAGGSLGRFSVSLDRFYPDEGQVLAGLFLSGENVATPSPSPSVFWFASLGDGTFRQYNWAPFETCHWDQLQWTGSLLRYQATRDDCGTASNEIDYSPGVAFLPQRWAPGSSWAVSGTSAAVYTDHGQVVCRGVNQWASRAVSTGPTYVFDDQQNITWTWGSDPSGCAAGQVTRWYENFTLGTLPVGTSGSTAGALVREFGGNVDRFDATGRWDYDVRFSSWQPLPT
jgi:hypothetical protein